MFYNDSDIFLILRKTKMVEVVLAICAKCGGKDDGNYDVVDQKAGGYYIVLMLIML